MLGLCDLANMCARALLIVPLVSAVPLFSATHAVNGFPFSFLKSTQALALSDITDCPHPRLD